MSTETTETGQDVFDDSGAGEAGAADQGQAGSSQDTQTGGEGDDSAAGGQQTDKTGDKGSATPAEDQDDPETVTDEKGQKFIPEHRFKAALKSATERAEKAEAEAAKLNQPAPIEIPDKETDPEGHAQHIRMEASVSVMREMRSDYQEVINHYATLAKDNPLLDQAVAADPLPAKLAYDIAKRDLEIKKVDEVLKSGEWDKFQEWKKTAGDPNKQSSEQQTKQTKTVANGLGAVPNLNRSTNASPNRNVRTRSNSSDADDDLFKGAL